MPRPGGVTVEDHLTVVVAPGAVPDVDAARDVLARALAAHGTTGELIHADANADVAAHLATAGGEVVLVLPPGTPDVADLDLPGTAAVLRVDLDDRAADRSPRVRRHLRGRGVAGIRYAVDAWALHRTHPATVHPYGPDPDQHAELRLPPGEPPTSGHPVAVLVHGGYWRSRWEADLMVPMAADLAARGVATWNVEYRRPDDHDWDATTADVAAAMTALGRLASTGTSTGTGTGTAGRPSLDLTRVVTLGHSAGGQLVTRLAADLAADPAAPVRPVLTVSLAGVLDLVEADRHGLGAGAVAAALGGHADSLPGVYAASSPVHRLPVGLPLALVCGRADDPHLLAMSRAFARAASDAGDDVVVVEADGDHFDVIDPASAIGRRTTALVEERVRR